MMLDKLPPEIIALILTNPVLIGPNRKLGISSWAYERRYPSRRSVYFICASVCKKFNQVLSTPYFRTQWNIQYNGGSVSDALLLATKNGWADDSAILCARYLHREIGIKRDLILTDCLIHAVCEYCSLPAYQTHQNQSAIVELPGDTCPSLDIIADYSDTNCDIHSDTEINTHPESEIINLYMANHSLLSTGSTCNFSQTLEDVESFVELRNMKRRRFSRVAPYAASRIHQPSLDTSTDNTIIYDKLIFNKVIGIQSIISNFLELGADVQAISNFPLRRAARHGCTTLCRLFLDHGANVNCKDDEAVDFAAGNGRIAALGLLLDAGGSPITAIRRASMRGDLNMLKMLLSDSSGAFVHKPWKKRLLHWICIGWQNNAIEDSLRVWEVQNECSKHPVVICARNGTGHNSCLEYLCEFMSMQPSTCFNAFNFAIRQAAQEGRCESVRILANYGANVGLALQFASRAGKIDVVSQLLNDFRLYFETASSRENLILALRQSNDIAITDMLMRFGHIKWSDVTDHYMNGGGIESNNIRSSNYIERSSSRPFLETFPLSVGGSRNERLAEEHDMYSRFTFNGNDGSRISMFVRETGDEDELLVEETATVFNTPPAILRNQWRRRFGRNNMI